MSPVAVLLVVGLAVAGWVVWIYRRRELPVRGRALLAALRVSALLIVVLLLLDPRMPGAEPSGAAARWILLDASASMEAGTPGTPASSWRRALAAVDGDADPILLFGGELPEPVEAVPTPPDGEPGPPPSRRAAGSRLVPALEAAAEGGARSVHLVSDLRIADAAAARAAVGRLGLGVRVTDVGGPVRNAAVVAFGLPDALENDEPVPAEVVVEASPEAAGDSATLEIREEGRPVATRRVGLPEEGRRLRTSLELPPPAGEGARRYEARIVLAGDAWPRDDARPAWGEVDPREGALVLVGAEPDWELRFLAPTLSRVTGLRTRGFLRAGSDRWLVMDPAGGTGTVEEARVVEEAQGAALLVVQGGGEDGPPWLDDVVGAAGRVMVLASGAADAALAGVSVGSPLAGEWYVDDEIPPSPVASSLTGLAAGGLPPLGPALPLRDTAAAVPLRIGRAPGSGDGAALALVRDGGGRRVVSLAPGWWRWAFRSEEGREAYSRVWSAAAGWLLAADEAPAPGIRPVSRIVEGGERPEWIVGGVPPEPPGLPVRLSVTPVPVGPEGGDAAGEDPGEETDTTLVLTGAGRFATEALPPGLYRWRAWIGSPGEDGAGVDGAADGEPDRSGRLDVTGWSDELLHPRAVDLGTDPGVEIARAEEGAGRPLRTHPLPYLLVLGLLSAEWILRRRSGLR